MFDFPPEKIIWCYGAWQNGYNEISREIVEFIPGLKLNNIDPNKRNLIIIDDLMSETNQDVTKLFTKDCHHSNTTVFFLVQNLFNKGREHRTISLNSHYIIIFKNPRDRSQIDALARQVYPGNAKFMRNAYLDATSKPYSYLFCDFRAETPEELRLRTSIFPDEITSYVYNSL